MNNKKLRQLNILVIITIVASFIVMCVLSVLFAPEVENTIYADNVKEFSSDWIVQNFDADNDVIVDLPFDSGAAKEEITVILHRVPEDVTKDTCLLFYTEFQNISVSVGEETVYTNGVLNNQKRIKNAVPGYNVIPLNKANPDDIITIYITSDYNKYSGKIGKIYYGSRGDIVLKLIKENAVSYIFSVSLFLVAFILIILVAVVRNVRVDKMKALYGFSFVLTMSLWSILSNPIMQLISSNAYAIYTCSMILLLLMPILYVMYLRCFALKRRYAKIFEISIYIYGINLLTGIIFQIINVCDFATYNIFTTVLIVLGLVLLSGIMYLAAGTYKDKNIYNNLVANIILGIAWLCETICSFFGFYESYDGVILQMGILIYLVVLVVGVGKNVIREMNRSTEEVISSVKTEKEEFVKKLNTKLIFNAMNVSATALKKTNKEESRLIYDITAYMKYNIKAVNETGLVPFSAEMEYIKAYLGIQSRKNEGIEIDIEDKVVDFKVPFNTIEPLVENAFENGASKAEYGRIVVRSYERLDCFAIQIVDNGKGIGPDKSFDGKEKYKDLKKRISTMCHGAIEVKNKPGKGTIVTVKIPKDGYIIKEK